MSPLAALRHLEDLRRERGAYGLRLQRDGQGAPFLLLWGEDAFFVDASPGSLRQETAPADAALALATAETCADGAAALAADGTLHLQTRHGDGPQAARLLGRIGRIDVRLPSRGPGFGGACPMPRDGEALLLLPDDDRPSLSAHRVLDAATRATAAGFPAPVPRPTAALCTGLLVLRREGRVALLPLDDQGLRISSWPLHSSVPRREGEER